MIVITAERKPITETTEIHKAWCISGAGSFVSAEGRRILKERKHGIEIMYHPLVV